MNIIIDDNYKNTKNWINLTTSSNIKIQKTLKLPLYLNYDFKEKDKNVKINIDIAEKVSIKILINIINCNKLEETINLNSNSKLFKQRINIAENKDIYSHQIHNLNENAELKYNLITLAINKIKEINQIEINHLGSFSKSNVNFNSIVQNSYVEGNVIGNVKNKKAINCKVIQKLYSILMDNNAKAINRPILNIYNHNLIARHANAIGQINPNQIFYLKTKGISEKQAKLMIFLGLLKKNFDKIPKKIEKIYIQKIKQYYL